MWAGTAMVGTTVSVWATATDTALHDSRRMASDSFTVRPRPVENFQVNFPALVDSNTIVSQYFGFYPYFIGSEGLRATFGLFYAVSLLRIAQPQVDSVARVETGPDSGLYFLRSVPQMDGESVIYLHPALHGGGGYPLATQWYAEQNGATPPPHRCDAAHVSLLSTLAKNHEGVDEMIVTSHYGIFKRFVETESLSTRFERQVYKARNVSDFWKKVSSRYSTGMFERYKSLQDAHDSTDYPNIFGNQAATNGPFGLLGCRIFKNPNLIGPL
jgi:hypothetical protein